MLMAGCFDTRETAAGAVVFVKRRGEESLLTSTAHVNMRARIGSLPLVRYTGYELSSLEAGWIREVVRRWLVILDRPLICIFHQTQLQES